MAADGNSFNASVTVALTNPDGTYFAGFEATTTSTRLVAQSRPSLESIKAGTPPAAVPAATPTA